MSGIRPSQTPRSTGIRDAATTGSLIQYAIQAIPKYIREPAKVFVTARNLLRGRQVETFIVSWPKTGRTWLRVMLGRVLLKQGGHPEKLLLDTYALSKRAGGDRAMFCHGGPLHLFDLGHYEHLVFNYARYEPRKVVFLIRDCRDTLVSSYFQESKRVGGFEGSLSKFIRDPKLGIRKVASFYSLWFTNRDVPRQFMLLRYEDMHRDPAGELRRVIDFLGPRDTDDEVVREAVEYARFENMRRLEMSGKYKDSMLSAKENQNPATLKVRRGKIGGFADYVSEADPASIAAAVDELRLPECEWYYHQQP